MPLSLQRLLGVMSWQMTKNANVPEKLAPIFKAKIPQKHQKFFTCCANSSTLQ